ncbi:fibroblast growth factor 9-like [Glandiceps talaboti]
MSARRDLAPYPQVHLLCTLLLILFYKAFAHQLSVNDLDFPEWNVHSNVFLRRVSKSTTQNRHEESSAVKTLTIDDFLMFRQLVSANGYYLRILPGGIVTGITADHDPYGILQIRHTTDEIVTVRGVKADLYLAMNKKGELYTSTEETKNCFLKREHVKNWFYTFASARYPRRRRHRRKWYIGLHKNGRPKLGSRAKPRQAGTKFLIRPVDPQKIPDFYPFQVSKLLSPAVDFTGQH